MTASHVPVLFKFLVTTSVPPVLWKGITLIVVTHVKKDMMGSTVTGVHLVTMVIHELKEEVAYNLVMINAPDFC